MASLAAALGAFLWETIRWLKTAKSNGQRTRSIRGGDAKRLGIDQIIVGGESGPHARPCVAEWILDIIHQCKAVGVACFVKQLGAVIETSNVNLLDWGDNQIGDNDPDVATGPCSWTIKLKHSKGGNMDEWPEDLQVREMPDD